MKVILLKDVENVGKKYEVKDVKPGHARNLLIPQNLVKPATKQNMEWLEVQKKVMEAEVTEELKQVQELASQIDGLEVAISVKIGEDGQLFESINAQKISEKLKEMGFVVKKAQVSLEKPIKEAGEFAVKINLDHNLEGEINLIITGEKEAEI